MGIGNRMQGRVVARLHICLTYKDLIYIRETMSSCPIFTAFYRM